MAEQSSAKAKQTHRAGSDELGAARASTAGSEYEWHFGRVARVGSFEVADGRAVTIVWDEGGVSCQQGEITDGQWEIFKLAFSTTGRIAVLSEERGDKWMYDFRFLEATR